MRSWRFGEAVGLVGVLVATGLAVAAAGSAVAAPRVDREQAPAQATIAPGHIKVRGRIFYIDRNSDRNHPAAGLKVEVYDKDERAFGPYELLDTTVTDAAGFFESASIANVDPDGPSGQAEGTQDIFLKIYTDNGTVRVFETGTNRPFSWTSYQIAGETEGILRNVPDGLVGIPPLYVMEDTLQVEALWTYVNLVEGWLYLKDKSGEDPGPVTAYWSAASQDGPRYDPTTRAIYLRDADAGFAHVVVQQEAYAFLHTLYGTLPPAWDGCTAGPLEGLKDAAATPACAFAQGFATFYPLAVYADAAFESLATRALDLDAPAPTTPGWAAGDGVPGRVAGALWDLAEADASTEQYDLYNATFLDQWDVLARRKPTTMRDWWTGWLALGKEGCQALGSLYQNSIDYNTAPQVARIDDVTLDEDTTRVFDLATYVSDAECPDDQLSYTMIDAGSPLAGVHLVPTSIISITPETNWFGTANVSVRVSDGPASVVASFRVVVRSVNDCPEIAPPIQSVQTIHGQPITLNLLGHGRDVEDQPFALQWDAELDAQDENDVLVAGRGSTVLTFSLVPTVIQERNVRSVVTVEDVDGCVTRQPVLLSWAARPNRPPTVWYDRLTREYIALMNTDINVDLTGVATDDEDGEAGLEWRVVNQLDHSGWGYVLPDDKQILYFRPHPDYVGSQKADLRVADSAGAVAPPPPDTAVITLTWVSQLEFNNLPPYILKNKLRGKTVGVGTTACYDLRDKAEDPDDPQSSLRWFVIEFDDADVQVSGQGTQRICLRPAPDRIGFEGCMRHEFVVQDPKNAESAPYGVTTCWRTIRNFFPFTQRSRY